MNSDSKDLSENESVERTKKKTRRVIRVIKRLETDSSVRDGVEEDLALENSDNCSIFLRSQMNLSFDLKKRTEMIGTPETFKKLMGTTCPQKDPIRRLKTKVQSRDAQADFEKKLALIEEGKAREKKIETQHKRKLSTGQRFVYNQEKKCLKQFKNTTKHWKHISSRLSASLNKDEESLLLNSGQEWRQRTEMFDFLDRITPVSEKTGTRTWSSTLRDYEKVPVGETYEPLGNIFLGLYTCIRSKPPGERELIRRNERIPVRRRSVATSEYYKLKVKNAPRHLKMEVITDARPMTVQGRNKFTLEKDAVTHTGVECCDPFAVTPPETEEVFEENYDVRYKY